jgi:hypothetical protein
MLLLHAGVQPERRTVRSLSAGRGAGCELLRSGEVIAINSTNQAQQAARTTPQRIMSELCEWCQRYLRTV